MGSLYGLRPITIYGTGDITNCGHRNSPLLVKWTYCDLIGQVSYYVGEVVTHSECTEIKGRSIESNKFVSSLLQCMSVISDLQPPGCFHPPLLPQKEAFYHKT